MTKFSTSGVLEIVVSSRLDEEGGKVSERRIRTTLAHEGGHCLLHCHLFALVPRQAASLWRTIPSPINPKCCVEMNGFLVPSTQVSGGKSKQIRRWLACCSQSILWKLLLNHISLYKAYWLKNFGTNDREKAARELADVFDVNPIVVRFRIEQLFHVC